MIAFEYVEPDSLDEALALLAEHGEDAKPLAGGTGLLNLMKQRLVQPAYLVGLRRLARRPELGGIQADGGLDVGALCSQRVVETSPLVREHAPLLTETLHRVATVRIRTSATLGGALAHADPNQDPPAALLVLDARAHLASARGERDVPLDELFVDYYETALHPDELITRIKIPALPLTTGAAYVKFLPQTHDDYATVAAAARVSLRDGRIGEARVALAAAGPTPLRSAAVEAALRGQRPSPQLAADAAALVADEVEPVADFRGSEAFKRDMAVVMVRRAIEQAIARALNGQTTE